MDFRRVKRPKRSVDNPNVTKEKHQRLAIPFLLRIASNSASGYSWPLFLKGMRCLPLVFGGVLPPRLIKLFQPPTGECDHEKHNDHYNDLVHGIPKKENATRAGLYVMNNDVMNNDVMNNDVMNNDVMNNDVTNNVE